MKKYQYNYTINIYCGCESGTTYSENPAYGWVFAFLGMEIRSPHLRPD